MVTQISFALTAVLFFIVLYFFIRPEKIIAKKPHFTKKNLRIRLGIGLVLGLIAMGLKLPSLIKKDEQPSDSQAAMMQKYFSDRLTRYDETAKTRPFTKSCVPFQIAEVRKQYAQLSEEVLRLAAEDTCACMATYLKDLEGFKKVESALGEGKEYGSAMDEFMDTNEMMEKAQPCMEQ